jgi:hypothetical protein
MKYFILIFRNNMKTTSDIRDEKIKNIKKKYGNIRV